MQLWLMQINLLFSFSNKYASGKKNLQSPGINVFHIPGNKLGISKSQIVKNNTLRRSTEVKSFGVW